MCSVKLCASEAANLCACGGPLLVRYDLETIRHRWLRRDVGRGPANMWRYAPVLPPLAEHIVSLGEGWTPLIRARRLGARIGAESLWVKDEGMNPTGSFKARGLPAPSPCAWNWASARWPCARPATPPAPWPLMPPPPASRRTSSCRRDAPQANYLECKAYGASVTLVDGLIGECGSAVAARAPEEGWFDLGALQRALPHRRQ